MLAMRRSRLTFAVTLTLIAVAPALAQNLCRPTLTINDVLLSPIEQPNLQRKWTAIVVGGYLRMRGEFRRILRYRVHAP